MALACLLGTGKSLTFVRRFLDTSSLLWGLLFGSIGLGFFVYGRRQKRVVPLACGVALMVFPYFVSNTIRPVIIHLCAVIEIGTGISLLLRPSVILACRVLFPFLLLWMALLKLPGLFLAPHVMVSWEAFGEIAATSAGGWCVFAAHAGAWE